MKFIIKTPEDFLRLLNKEPIHDDSTIDHIYEDGSDIDDFDIDNFDIDSSYLDNSHLDNDMHIIDVSEFTPIIIKKTDSSDIPDNKSFNNNHWYHKLNLYSIGYRHMPMQVKVETKKLFEEICSYLDDELKSKKSLKKTSLMKVIRKSGVHQSSQEYILNILYYISEEIVISYYTKENSGNHNDYQYDKLKIYLGNRLVTKVYAMAEQLGEKLPPADEGTRRYYNLTESGLQVLWWDSDGRIREEATFDYMPKKVMSSIPRRQTKVWGIMGVRKLMVTLYLDIFSMMINCLNTEIKWNNKVKKTLSDMVADKDYMYMDYDYGGLFTSLIKLSENTVREMIPYTTSLNIDEDIENIRRFLPKVIVDNIFTLCNQYQESISKDELHKVVGEMAYKAPGDWKLKVWQILSTSGEEQINLIISYANDVNFIKMIKEVINKADGEDLLLFCLYGLSMKEKLSAKNTKLLNKLIYFSNMPSFNKLQDERYNLTISLYKELAELKNPIRKKIEFNLERIKESKDILNHTVDKISEYIGEDIAKDIVEITDLMQKNQNLQARNEENNNEINNHTQGIKLKYLDFIKSLLDREKLEINTVKDIATKNGALLNSFISDVNKELYEYLQDQAIIVDENYVMIDEFYIEMIKELLNGTKISE